MKKVLALIMVFAVLMTTSACGGSSSKGDSSTKRLVGNWVCQIEEDDDYPHQFILNSDGTGIGDGFSMTWYTKNDTLEMTASILGTLSYTYHFEGNILYLDDYPYEKQ